MSDVEILRIVLAVVGVVLVLLLYWFGRADKKVFRQHEEDFVPADGKEPFVSNESFNLDMNEKEIKSLSRQVEGNNNTKEIFEDVDAFYDNVIAEQSTEQDDVAPLPNIPRFNGEQEKAEKLKSKTEMKPVHVPAWLQIPETAEETKAPEETKTSAVNESNEPKAAKEKAADQVETKVETVALFKTDSTDVPDNINESISFVNTSAQAESQVDNGSDITPLKNIVNDANHASDKEKTGNPYLDGFKEDDKKQTSKERRKNKKKNKRKQQQMQQDQASQFADPWQADNSNKIKMAGEMAGNAAKKAKFGEEHSVAVKQGANTFSNTDGVAITQSSQMQAVPIDSDYLDAQDETESIDDESLSMFAGMKKISYEEDTDLHTQAALINQALEGEDDAKTKQQESVAAMSNTNPIIRPPKDPNERVFKLSFYLSAATNKSFSASDVAKVAQDNGLILGDETTFYMLQETAGEKQVIFSVCDKKKACSFRGANDEEQTTSLLAFDLNSEQSILSRLHILDSMLRVARNMEHSLHGKLYDIAGCQITDLMITHLRRQVQEQDLKINH